MELKTKKQGPLNYQIKLWQNFPSFLNLKRGNISEFTLQEEAAQASNMALNLMNLTLDEDSLC